MKKTIVLLSVASMLGIVVAGAFSGAKEAKRASAEEETFIDVSDNFFTDWTDDAGGFKDVGATFWGEGYSFEALGKFYSGESKEGWTGTLTSRTWDQSTQYIYFQLGAAKDFYSAGESEATDGARPYIRIHYGTYYEDFYNNTFVENPMTLRYYKIPDDKFALLTASDPSFKMYLELIDGRTRNYGFFNFGYLHVNQSAESTSDAMRYYLNHLSTDTRDWEYNERKQILNSYYDNAYQREVFLRTVSNADEDFENNNSFINHWYYDHNYANNDGTAKHFDEVISTADARTAESSNMPYNKTGSGLFKGWWDDAGRGGFTATDGAIYRFVSRPFVLSGTGLVSIKMAGRSASLHVIDTNTRSDLAWVDLRTYNPEGGQNNVVLGGMNTVTMVRHIINLEEYVGRTIQLAIADVFDSGWAASYFDELVTYYASNPAFKVDSFTQTNDTGTFHGSYRDVFVNSTSIDRDANGVKYNSNNDINKENESAILNHNDTGDMKAAYDFVKYYFDNFRTSGSFFSFCDVASETKTTLTTNYSNLSANAQAIVDASNDFDHGENREGNWYEKAVRVGGDAKTVGYNVQYIARRYGLSINVKNGALVVLNNTQLHVETSTALIVAIITSVAVLGFAALIILRKRKQD